ncbi:hypothetical protein M409DRAFT_53897 [Zasmidium cellare ATCC 36951]|uniref:Uncharacterized protein n=1 Tax=Zasmidium cellare ATCC 36951 TaxID=1080233 RepID=A0A6A6CNY2_ZASCE|nr:uncharacterized protein M409DRAFT_53897 [Zasmidium cellare ATCC 36951]KAF2167958.1 hypothetical protein M409DRAFT_53897 [Zasmidium cellare ATCC 36951]
MDDYTAASTLFTASVFIPEGRIKCEIPTGKGCKSDDEEERCYSDSPHQQSPNSVLHFFSLAPTKLALQPSSAPPSHSTTALSGEAMRAAAGHPTKAFYQARRDHVDDASSSLKSGSSQWRKLRVIQRVLSVAPAQEQEISRRTTDTETQRGTNDKHRYFVSCCVRRTRAAILSSRKQCCWER